MTNWLLRKKGFGVAGQSGWDTSDANCRLAAAAPELLEACVEAYTYLVRRQETGVLLTADEHALMARWSAVIALAKGEE
jgi:hypothetical protein